MKKVKTEKKYVGTFVIPVEYVSYVVRGVDSGLCDRALAVVDAFLDNLPKGTRLWDVSDFDYLCDASCFTFDFGYVREVSLYIVQPVYCAIPSYFVCSVPSWLEQELASY